jgi:AraC-like DNA-binding protein
MVNEVIKELQAAKAKVAALEQSLAEERNQTLAGLPAEYGFDDLGSFIKALKDAAGAKPAGKRRGRKPGKPAKAAAAAGGRKRSKRARITPEVKDKVKAAVGAGKTGAEIAKELGISVPSVQNIKKEFGLVKSRS